MQIFRVVAVFVLGKKLQYNWFSGFYLFFFFNRSCFQKIAETKYSEFIKTYLFFRLELCVKLNCDGKIYQILLFDDK